MFSETDDTSLEDKGAKPAMTADPEDRAPMTTTIVYPEYLRHFKCLGSACKDHCCYGWDIVMDKVTYKKLQGCQENAVSVLFRQHVKKNKADFSDQHYARISKINDHCAFLTAERLCLIQSRLGEAFLPDVCATFPRHFRAYGRRVEMSASVSCPEIARLAIGNPDGIDLVESQYQINRLKPLRMKTMAESFHLDPSRAALTAYAMQLMKNRGYELWERLLLLGVLCQEASRLDAEGRSNERIALLDTFARHVQSGFFAGILAQAPVMTSLQLQLVKRLTDEKAPSIRVKAFSSVVDDCFSGWQYEASNAPMPVIQKRYDLSYKKYFKPFLRQHGYIFENDLVNFLFSSALSVSGGKGLYDQFVLAALHFAMIKAYWIGMAALDQAPLDPGRTIDLICAFTKTMEPDARFKSYALKLLQDSGCGDVMSVSVLLKNE